MLESAILARQHTQILMSWALIWNFFRCFPFVVKLNTPNEEIMSR